MQRRELLVPLAALLACPRAVRAQAAGRSDRIGFLRVGPVPESFLNPFRQGLRHLGHIEGQNFELIFGLVTRVADLPEAAARLIRLKADVLVASGTPSVVPAKNASPTTPVVFVAAIDPVAAGLATSLARPGGNVTGVSAVHADVTGKRLEILRDLVPKLSTVALLVRDGSPATDQYVQEAGLAARALGLRLQVLSVHGADQLDEALRSAGEAGALVVVDDAVFTARRGLIAELALKYRVATISGLRETVDAGGLVSYGPHYGDLYRRAAGHVHEILRGAKPASLAIEQPRTFELVINLKTAGALGLDIPASLVGRADVVLD
jgi:putative ABC transport system substrate-binding protein